MLQIDLVNTSVPEGTVSFTEFQASRVEGIVTELDEPTIVEVGDNAMSYLEGVYHIGILQKCEITMLGGKYFLMLGEEQYVSDDLAMLEARLYFEWYVCM